MMVKKLIYGVLLVFLLGCSKYDYKGAPQFVLYVEDSPADYQTMMLSIDLVELYDGAQWVAVKNYSGRFSLLSLVGGNSLRIVQSDIAAGHYTKLRLTFNPNNSTLMVGDREYVLVTDDASRVVEMDMDFNIGDNEQYITVCDIDAARSVVGDPEVGFSFVPRCELMNLATAGAINGVVADENGVAIAEKMLVRATSALGVVKYGYTNPNDAALFMRLLAGEYQVVVTPGTTSKYEGITWDGVVVNSGQATMMGAVKLKTKPQE